MKEWLMKKWKLVAFVLVVLGFVFYNQVAKASWEWETNGRGNLIATWDVSGADALAPLTDGYEVTLSNTVYAYDADSQLWINRDTMVAADSDTMNSLYTIAAQALVSYPYDWVRWRPLQNNYRLQYADGVYTLGTFSEIQDIVGSDYFPDAAEHSIPDLMSVVPDFIAQFGGQKDHYLFRADDETGHLGNAFIEAWDTFVEIDEYPWEFYEDQRDEAIEAWDAIPSTYAPSYEHSDEPAPPSPRQIQAVEDAFIRFAADSKATHTNRAYAAGEDPFDYAWAQFVAEGDYTTPFYDAVDQAEAERRWNDIN